MSVDKDRVCAAMRQQFTALSNVEFEELKEKWRKEAAQSGVEDGGCGHGLIRFLYDREFTPCHCGDIPARDFLRKVIFCGTTNYDRFC